MNRRFIIYSTESDGDPVIYPARFPRHPPSETGFYCRLDCVQFEIGRCSYGNHVHAGGR